MQGTGCAFRACPVGRFWADAELVEPQVSSPFSRPVPALLLLHLKCQLLPRACLRIGHALTALRRRSGTPRQRSASGRTRYGGVAPARATAHGPRILRTVHAEEAARRRVTLKEACRSVERLVLLLSENGGHEELALEAIRRSRRVERIAAEADTRPSMTAAQQTLDRALALLRGGAHRGVASIEFFIAVVVSLDSESTAQSPSPFLQLHEDARRLTAELAPLLHSADEADPIVQALLTAQGELWSVASTDIEGVAATRRRLRTQRAALRLVPG